MVGIFATALVLLTLRSAAFATPFGSGATSSAARFQSASQNTETSPAEQPQPRAYTLPPDKEARAIAYAHARHELYFLDFLFTTVGLALLVQLAVAPRLRDWAEHILRHRFLRAVIFAGPFFILLGLLSLPAAAAGHWLQRHYGQSVQGWGSWFWDALKGGAIALVLAIFLMWLFYGLVRRSPRRWWLYAWLGSLPLLVFLIFVEPVVLEPLFFRFTPLAASDPQLAAELERVVQHGGQQIPETRMYLMNASSKLNALNAYVSGIGASERVVVWDTTIAQMTTPEILFVFGHEMGHYVLHHIRNGILFTAGLLLIFLFGGFHALHWALARFGAAWKIRAADDWASLPVLIFAILIFNFIFTPIDNAYSRHLEHQADQYGLEVAHGIVPNSSQVAAQSFQILGEIDLAEPSPSTAVKIWFYDHPPLDERILFAQTYDPWDKGESPEFVK
ncbi:MAG TPA: M48 family metallopeptidase [Rugosimonospora sp.]|nr:M48 family metallopeptidase [Rugosimonospora sp.]